MKKTLYLFGATMIAPIAFVSCTKQEEQPKNYYGVQQPTESHGTPKEAYYAFFGAIVVIGILLMWFLKKAGKK